MSKPTFAGVALTSAIVFASAPAMADAVADFYKGKQIRFVVRTTPGGDYDQYSRLLAQIGRAHV